MVSKYTYGKGLGSLFKTGDRKAANSLDSQAMLGDAVPHFYGIRYIQPER
jgi:hypothetical protein